VRPVSIFTSFSFP